MVGPVGVFFNVPGVTSLRINACTLTKVFTGAVSRWNDPAIASQNPGVALPNQQILVFTRKSGSSSTFGAQQPPPPFCFPACLCAVCPPVHRCPSRAHHPPPHTRPIPSQASQTT